MDKIFKIIISNVFFHVEFEYEIGFSLAITVFAAEGGGTIIILHPVNYLKPQYLLKNLKGARETYIFFNDFTKPLK